MALVGRLGEDESVLNQSGDDVGNPHARSTCGQPGDLAEPQAGLDAGEHLKDVSIERGNERTEGVTEVHGSRVPHILSPCNYFVTLRGISARPASL